MKKKMPKELNRIVDKVLAFKPKPRSKAAKKRAAKQIECGVNHNRTEKAAD